MFIIIVSDDLQNRKEQSESIGYDHSNFLDINPIAQPAQAASEAAQAAENGQQLILISGHDSINFFPGRRVHQNIKNHDNLRDQGIFEVEVAAEVHQSHSGNENEVVKDGKLDVLPRRVNEENRNPNQRY